MSAGRGAGLAAIGLAMVGFSWGFIIVRLIGMHAPILGFWRLCIGAVVLSACALVLRVPWPRTYRELAWAGVAFGAHQLSFICATLWTSVAIVTVVAATQPLLVALVSRRIVGERVPRSIFVSIFLALLGVVIVVFANRGVAGQSLLGNVMAVVNVFVFTGYFLAAKRARAGGAPTLTLTAGMLTIAAVVVLPIVGFTGVELPNQRQWGLLAILALGSGNGHLLINWAHSRVPAVLSSLALALIPVLASTWAALVLDEPYTWKHALGMILVVTALEMARRAKTSPCQASSQRNAGCAIGR